MLHLVSETGPLAARQQPVEVGRMRNKRQFLGVLFFSLAGSLIASTQDQTSVSTAGAPPKLLLLVHREIKFGKAGERQKLEASLTRAFDRLTVPNSWIGRPSRACADAGGD